MDYFKQMGVYRKVPRQEAKDAGVRVITTKSVSDNLQERRKKSPTKSDPLQKYVMA